MTMLKLAVVAATGLVLSGAAPVQADPLQELGEEFWVWRADTQPASGDDIPRIVRPEGWTPDWSPGAVQARYDRAEEFEERWRELDGTASTVSESVDYRLVGSALARVRWELDHVAAWRRQPHFYVQQSLVPVFEALLPPPPLGRERLDDVLRLVQAVPAVLEDAQANLDDMRGPFVQVALSQIEDVPASLRGMAEGLRDHADAETGAAISDAVEAAVEAFEQYRIFLEDNSEGLGQETSVGRDSYAFFLNEVALYPYSPEELLIMGRQEWSRAVVFEELETNRRRDLEPLPVRTPVEAVIEQLDSDELDVRAFLEANDLLTVPDDAGHYNAQAFPSYLAPIGWLGRTFDLTDRHRLDQDATVYLPDPSPDLGYFNLSITRDPRPIIVHEGVPGHYFQLALSWAHPNPLRRHYYDSGANEGTGFYAEEMMLQAGLFDDLPQSREIIYNFGRLRALRVEVDVRLALGEYTIEDAAHSLETKVPMDRRTAEEEAIFFAASPGQAISYQIGKLQTHDFLAEARLALGDDFDLRHFHDYLWLNGNVPIELLKEEYLSIER
jgi:hypothetical protein